MALNFESVGRDRLVNVGSAAILDSIEIGTIAAWVRPTSAFSSSTIYCKDVGPGTAATRALWIDTSTGDIELFHDRATTDLIARSTTTTPLSVWSFVAGTYNTGGGDGDQHIYLGGKTRSVQELAYSTRTVGSGTITSDAASSGMIGNQGGAFREFRGDIAWIGVWARQLSLDQLEDQRKRLRVTPGCVLFMHLGYESEVGRQLDWSGWHNHGAPAGTPARATHPDWLRPTRKRRRTREFVQAAAAAATTVRRDNLLLLGVS